jgi:hypothetical protein
LHFFLVCIVKKRNMKKKRRRRRRRGTQTVHFRVAKVTRRKTRSNGCLGGWGGREVFGRLKP